METNTNLTALELAGLRAIDASEYGEFLLDEIWAFSVADNIDKSIAKKSVPGIVSSLSKKGLVRCSGGGQPISRGAPDDATTAMTDKGVEVYTKALAAIGEKPKKYVNYEAYLAANPI